MKKKNIFKALGIGALCLTGALTFAGCGKTDTQTTADSQIREVYAMAVDAGYTGTYEEWIESIKGKDGLTPFIGINGNWWIGETDTGVQAQHKEATYTVTYDNKYEICFDDISSDTITKGDWLVDLPHVKDEFADKFLGWYLKNSDKQIQNGDEIKANITLEARFSEKLSGLYQNGKYVKTWEETINDCDCADYVNGNKISFPTEYCSYDVSKFTNVSIYGNELVIDGQINIIGPYAFAGLSNIKVVFPLSLQSIESQAFATANIESVYIPYNVVNIDPSAFWMVENLKTIEVDPSNTMYDSRTNCNAIIETSTNKLLLGCKNTVIPKDIKIIGESAFNHCDQFQFNSIPESVEKIEFDAFAFCKNLNNLKLVNVKEIGDQAFLNADVDYVILSNKIESIGNNAFFGSNIESIYYESDFEHWNLIEISSQGLYPTGTATIYYYAEIEPTEEGNYWHYDTDGVTPIIWEND